MFFPQTIKYDLWNLALEMNPQPGVLGARVPATTPGIADTFTNYNLLRITYQELTDDQLLLVGAGLADQWREWTIYQVDLDQALAPQPQPKWTLTIKGQIWTIEKVQALAMNQAFPCLCRLSQPA